MNRNLTQWERVQASLPSLSTKSNPNTFLIVINRYMGCLRHQKASRSIPPHADAIIRLQKHKPHSQTYRELHLTINTVSIALCWLTFLITRRWVHPEPENLRGQISALWVTGSKTHAGIHRDDNFEVGLDWKAPWSLDAWSKREKRSLYSNFPKLSRCLFKKCCRFYSCTFLENTLKLYITS